MRNIENTSWKTTIAGILSGIAIVLIPILQTGEVTLQKVAIGVGIALLGIFAKDHDKHGDPTVPIVND